MHATVRRRFRRGIREVDAGRQTLTAMHQMDGVAEDGPVDEAPVSDVDTDVVVADPEQAVGMVKHLFGGVAIGDTEPARQALDDEA